MVNNNPGSECVWGKSAQFYDTQYTLASLKNLLAIILLAI